MNTLEAMEKRSSCRSFTNEALSREVVEAVVRAGLLAPTATNRQELHFAVVQGNASVIDDIEDEKMILRQQPRQLHNFCYEAPVVIFLSAEDDFRWSQVDAGIAVQNMALMAEELGLGSLIIGSVYDALRGGKKASFKEALHIPADKEFQIAIAIGHKGGEKTPHSFDMEKQVSFV